MPLDIRRIYCEYQPGRSHTTMAVEAVLLASLTGAKVRIVRRSDQADQADQIAQIEPWSSTAEAARELDQVFRPSA